MKSAHPKPVIPTAEKERYTPIYDPSEIEAIKRNGAFDPIGACINGQTWCYTWSIQRWREKHPRQP